MSVKTAVVAAMLLGVCTPLAPVTAPNIARIQGAALTKACEGRDGWSDAAPPARIFGNTYYVGTCGITVLLVTSPNGHILIDGATAEAVPSILANIRMLGFEPGDVRLMVGSHEHVDHMGGFAALKAATGARLLVSAAARKVVESGKVDPADPQSGIIADMTPVSVDGELDNLPDYFKSLMLTAHSTAGHTDGGTSWGWQSCEEKNCVTFAYVDSLTAVSRDGYRFAEHPERITPFRETFARVERMPCDILVTPHPGVSNFFERLAGTEQLIDTSACRKLAQTMEKRLDDRLAQEAVGK